MARVRAKSTLGLWLLAAAGCTAPSPASTAGHLELHPVGAAVAEADVAVGATAWYVPTPPDGGARVLLHGGAPVRWASLDPAGRYVATVGIDGSLVRTDLGRGGAVLIARDVLETPAFDPLGGGTLLVAARTAGAEGNALHLFAPGAPDGVTIVPAGSHNERATFSPDAESIAFVSDRTGLPSVFVMSRERREPVQLTNVGIVRAPGKPPGADWVPPPLEGALAWTAERIEYASPRGSVRIDPERGTVSLGGARR